MTKFMNQSNKIKDSFNKVLNKYINIVFEKTGAGETPSAGTISLQGDNRICGYSGSC